MRQIGFNTIRFFFYSCFRDTMKEQYHSLLEEKGVPPPLPPDTFEVSNLMCLEYFCCCCPKWSDSLKIYIKQLSKTTRKREINIQTYFEKVTRRIWRYQSGNENLYMEEEQTTQWPKGKYKRTNNDLQDIHIKLKIE